jgi:hypothetical protein
MDIAHIDSELGPSSAGKRPTNTQLINPDPIETATDSGSPKAGLEEAKASGLKSTASLKNVDAVRLIPTSESKSKSRPLPEKTSPGDSSVIFNGVDSFFQFRKIWPDASRDERLMYCFSLQEKFRFVMECAVAFGWQYRAEFSHWLNSNSSKLQP